MMSRYRLRLLLAGCGLFLLALLLTVPAALLQRVLPPELQSAGFAGTLWQGEMHGVQWRGQPVVDQLRWDWQLSHLLLGRLTLDVHTQWQQQAGRARLMITPSALQLHQADLTLPLAPLIVDIPALSRFSLRGNVQLVSDEFRWSAGEGRGELQMFWRQARSDYSGDQVMGDYRIDLKAASKGYAVKVDTLDGVLRIQGDGTGTPGAGWNAGAVIEAPADSMPRFQTLLSQIGPPNPDGKYVLRYSFK